MTYENNKYTIADESKSVYIRDLSGYVIISAFLIKYLFSRDAKFESMGEQFNNQNENTGLLYSVKLRIKIVWNYWLKFNL